MSVKSLFDGKNPYKLLSSENLENLGAEVESSGNLNERLEEKNRFIPIVNFEFPENFARYGKAAKYYEDSFNRITDDYPYDGSLREKTEFRNESSYLDLYILDRVYPRTTGHATFSPNGWGTPSSTATNGAALSNNPEYVQVKGGPNQAPSEFLNKPVREQFPESNKYDPANNRESNLKFDFNQGVTVEFWMNKGEFISGTSYEIPFMLSNEDSGSLWIAVSSSLSASSDNSLYAIWTSGSVQNTLNYTGISNSQFTGSWHHFAFTFQNSGSDVVSKAYLDGDLVDSQTASSKAIEEVTGALKANIGAGRKLLHSTSAYELPLDGYGKLSGSIDEFRYWKTVRNSKEIGRYWFTETGGGTNDDIANTDLGVYFKFNEGITGTTSIDSNVLDYSGRISNGTWTGYTAQARSTSSAVDTYFGREVEFKDPIIYSSHPDVSTTKTDLINSGSEYDFQNNASIYNSIPAWITEEDELGSEDLLNLTQIMSSYFDTLHLQIEALPKIKDKVYNDPALIKPASFSSRLLESQGFVAPEIFADADVLEQILKRSEDRKYELDLFDIKNVIYQNIYNNITNIYKSKGTERSFRNLIRCFGVDEDLIRLNVYGNNSEYELRENYRTVSVKKNYADFNHPDRFAATVYQQTASANPNSVSYIEGNSSASYNPFTVEAEVIFPKKLEKSNSEYFPTPFITSSLFGFHSASSGTDYTWGSPDTDLKVYAVRDELESSNVSFRLEASQLSVSLESDVFYDTYDNDKWNISVRIKPEKVGTNLVSGTTDTNYLIEFTGYNSDAGVIVNEFYLTSSVSNIQGYTTSNKRLYLGAHRTNFTGSALEQTDVKISSLRYWASYLGDDVLKAHAADPSSFGAENPYGSTFLYETSLDGIRVPQIETLALNWDFTTVSSSDAGISGTPTVSDAGYLVPDVSSGSVALESRYGWLGATVGPQHTGRGDFYLPNDTKVADTKFVYAGVKTDPEVSQASNMINTLGESDIYFTRETRPINYYYSLEKSMYQTISDEMLKMFSTILDFNTLIGDPINKYRQNYKPMEKLRSLFFEKVENTPDLDKYVDFYKWLDTSLDVMLRELVPMSADVSDGIRTMIESHVLERNKYQHKLPTVEFKDPNQTFGIEGINKNLNNWKFNHHPINDQQDTNCQWWNERAERTNPVISSGDTGVDADRQKILEARVSAINRSYTTPYRFRVQESPLVKGGNNVRAPKSLDVARNQIKFGTSDGIELTQQKDFKDCTDQLLPNEKRKITADLASVPREEYLNVDFNKYFPYTLFSSSVQSGYQSGLTYALENTHRDVYGYDSEVPLQGPFTETHVGGLQFRHTPVNTGSDDATNRAEGWSLETSPALKITSVDTDKPRAPYYRDETAKRPLNIKNIKGDYGNYTKDYQIVQTNSRYINNKAWVSASGWDLFPEGTPSIWIAGMNDVPKIQRGRTEHVFVNRFSAPGGSETMGDANGGAGLDRYSAEFSPNNDINTRNITVREDFNQKLSSHVNQFGYFSGVNVPGATSSSVDAEDYSGTASIYQVNRNGVERLEYSGSDVITASFYDNYFVQHAIPRPERDFEYNWSGSLESDFVSFSSSIKFGKTSASAGSTAYVPTVYNGLNYNVYEPISPNSTFLGLDGSASIDYLNNTLIADGFQDVLSSASMLNAITLKRQGPYGHPTWKQIRTGEHPLARYYRNNNEYTVVEQGKKVAILGQTYSPKNGNTFTFKESVINSKLGNLDYTLGMRVETLDDPANPEYNVRTLRLKTVYGNNISYFDNEKLNEIAQYDKNFVASEEQAYDTLKSYYLDGALNSSDSPVYNLVSLKYSERMYPSSINCYRFENRERVGYGNTFWRNSRTDRNTLGQLKFNGSSSQGIAREQSAWALDGATQFDDRTQITTANTVAQISGGLGVCSAPAYMYETCSSGELQNDYLLAWQRWQSGPTSQVDDPARARGSIKSGVMYARPQGINSYWSVVNPMGSEYVNRVLAIASSRDQYLNPFERSDTSSLNPGGAGFEDGDILGYINSTTGRARFEAHDLAGIIRDDVFVTASTTPFYDSYGDFVLEPRLKNKDFSVVPEFRISEEMDFYFNQKGQDFLAENPNFLKIPGTSIASSDNEFYKDYSYSDFMKYFEVIDGDHKELPLGKTISLKCKAIKKFIPYDGFFPAERTLQIASHFSSSYYPSLNLDNSDEALERPFLKPFMAPGILYNTIKSGIAVDYPLHTSSFEIVNYLKGNGTPIGGGWSGGTSPTSYYALGTGSSGASGWDLRIPFEALLEPESIANIQLYDCEPNPQINIDTDSTASVPLNEKFVVLNKIDKADNIYKKSMSNFLAECREFFLQDLATFESEQRPEDHLYSFEPGTYGMRIRLRRSKLKGTLPTESPRGSGNYFLFPEDSPGEIEDDNNFETITMYSRPSAFGPPVAGGNSFPSVTTFDVGPDIDGNISQRRRIGLTDSLYGKNPSFTPPYYDGECWYDIVYQNTTSNTENLTLAELWEKARVNEIRIDPSGSWTNSFYDSENYPMSRENANNFAMKLSSCINPFVLKTKNLNPDGSEKSAQWVIQTKMETPVLNFSDKTKRPLNYDNITLPINIQDTGSFAGGTLMACEEATLNGYGGEVSTPIGMWHQFGLIPEGEKGIFLSLSDIDETFLARSTIDTAFYTDQFEMKSLPDVLGFSKQEKKIGRLKRTKTVYEAVVAIPYYIADGERKFFGIERDIIDDAVRNLNYDDPSASYASTLEVPAGESIVQMVRKIQKYVLPPRLDFVKNDSVDPFAMYIFEFSHTFDQDDLSYIWQNLTPRDGKKFEEATATVSHKLFDGELLKNFQDRVKFMVFKVKQRGNNNYYSILEGQPQELAKQEDYSFNWPYDYFSLVEFAKVDCEIEYSSDEKTEVDESNTQFEKALDTGVAATGGLPASPQALRNAVQGED